MWDAFNNWEVGSVVWVQQFSTPGWDEFWRVLTRAAEHWAIIPIMLIIFAIFGIKQSLKFGFVAGTAGLFTWFLKLATNRDRPHLVSDRVMVLYPPISSAFPSGHTAVGAAIAIGLCVLIWKLKIHKSLHILLCSLAVSIFAVGVAYSRIHLGVHYPSDVIAALILAVPFYLLSAFLFAQICKIPFLAKIKLHPRIKNGLLRKPVPIEQPAEG